MGPWVSIEEMALKDLSGLCDHTYLNRPEYFRSSGVNAVGKREAEFLAFLEGVLSLPHKPFALCVRPEDVYRSRLFLDKQGYREIRIASVVGFPDGCHTPTSLKKRESIEALDAGALEIDMVFNYEAFKRGDEKECFQDVEEVLREVHQKGGLLKLILETSELSSPQIAKSCLFAENCGVDFVKTSTGFTSEGATFDALVCMKKHFSRGIKMSGGVKESSVKALLKALCPKDDGMILLDPMKIRIGESSLL